jgi:pilus assembly protein CpaB
MERQRAQMVVKPVPKAERLAVLVAKANLGAGTFLKPGDTVWQVWPEGGLSPAYVVKGKRKIEEFVGSVVRSSIVAGQPITDGSVVKVGERGFLAAVLSPGLRAVSFPITASSGIAGLVFPGDRVDLILSHKFKTASSGKSKNKLRIASETLLTNVRIIAIDQRTDDQKEKKKKSGVPKIATLEVTPKQAEMVSVALNLGKLSLSLRSLAKNETGSAADAKKAMNAARGRTATMENEVSRLLSIQEDNDSINVLHGGTAEEGSAKGDAVARGANSE